MPGMSPRTQEFMQPPPSPEDAVRNFEEGFSQMAHGILSSKFPELVENVQTFKVLDSDIESGAGVGAFVLSINGETLYIPVVLASNQIKPLDVIYYKAKNIFLPLDKEWLDEISRNSLDALGEGVKPPQGLDADADIRDLVVPPTVGRHVYASFSAPGEKLAEFLTAAPNFVKKAFRLVLENNDNILKFAFANFDRKMLMDAMRPHIEKTAAVPEPIAILTPEDSVQNFQKFFGEKAAAAWQEATKTGYVIQDKRKRTNLAVETQEPIIRVTTQESGFYQVHMADGSVKLALVIPEPQEFESPVRAGSRTDMRCLPSEYWKAHRKTHDQVLVDHDANPDEAAGVRAPQQFLVYTENGDIITTTAPPVGKWVPAEEVSGPLAKLLSGEPQPIGRGYGFFLSVRGGKFSGTAPVEIRSVTTGSDGVRRIETTTGPLLVTDPNAPIAQIVAPRNGNVAYIPSHYQFVKGKYSSGQLLQGADDTLRYRRELEKNGALKVTLKDAGASMISIGGLEPQTKVAAIRTLMQDLNLRGNEARALIEKTAEQGKHSFYLVNPEQMAKFADWAKKAQGAAPMAPPPGGGMPPEMAGGAPPGGGMPPEMAGGAPPEAAISPEPPPTPPPSPVELAASEVEAALAQQSAEVANQLAEQQRDLSNQLSAIAAVKQRAEQIALEQAGVAPAGPPAEVPQVPPPGAMPPEAGAAVPMAGAMPPEAGAAVPMAGAMPPGGVEEAMAAEQLASQAAPAMEEAAELESPEAFEATAIGAMATDANLRGSIGNYLANLEKALDNLGRILLTLRMQEAEFRRELGENDFNSLEKRLQNVFNNLGALILRINQTTMAAPEEDRGEESS